MFYDIDLMNDSSLCKSWRAGNNQSIRENDNTSLSAVCEKLDFWLASDRHHQSGRLALRASSILINGTTRLYKLEAEKLLKDAFNLSRQMALNNYHCDGDDSEDGFRSSDTETEAEMTPEVMLESKPQDTLITSHRKRSMDAINSSVGMKRVNFSLSNSSWNSVNETFEGIANQRIDLLEDNDISSSTITKEHCPPSETIRKDKAVQMSNNLLYNTGERNQIGDHIFDQNLPFGVVIIHDKCQSRIPSKILLSSLNTAIKNI